MDAYDEGSKSGPGPDGPDGAVPDGSPRDASRPRALASEAPVPEGPAAETPDAGTVPPESVPAETAVPPESVPAETAVPPETLPAEIPKPENPKPQNPKPDHLTSGIAALPLRSQIAAALALAVVAVAACVHLGMVFLHVAPSNTVTKQHGRAIDEWIYPEFEQNWKLFAPNPLQQNVAVQVRALIRTSDGTSRETGWYDLSALDGKAIDGNPLPSHTQQNELRRAWDFYVGTHDGQNRPAGLRGDLSERYLRRVAVLRLHREHADGDGAVIERLQVRSRTTDVPPPEWSEEKVSDKPIVRELPWWAVPEGDREDGLTEASAR